ncbi:YARHG domain-containing protein [Patescibacteria group bacterium]|nr:YARHG domain-containing protein [Patescibacteria group bacterium]
MPISLKWGIAVIVFIILLVGIVLLGLKAGQVYGGTFIKMFPQGITSKLSAPARLSQTLQSVTPTVTSKPTPTGVSSANNQFVLPFSNTRAVVEADLKDLTPWQLKVARNEIYARYGRAFVSQDLACYFAKQSWYKENPAYSDQSLSSLEIANVNFISSFEKKINSPLINHDSGCQ